MQLTGRKYPNLDALFEVPRDLHEYSWTSNRVLSEIFEMLEMVEGGTLSDAGIARLRQLKAAKNELDAILDLIIYDGCEEYL